MSGFNDDYSDVLDPPQGGQQGGGGLRKQLEDALAQVNKLNEQLRQKSAEDLFKEKGIDPAAVNLVPKDADINEWLEKNQSLLVKAATETEPPPEAQVVNEQNQAEAQAMAQLNAAESAGSTPTTITTDPVEAIKNTKSEAEFWDLIRGGQA